MNTRTLAMKTRTLVLAAALTAFATPAFAFHCPGAMAKIDAALTANPGLSAGKLAEVKELRAEGERLHKSGKHYAAVATLWVAEELLGVEDKASEKVLGVGGY